MSNNRQHFIRKIGLALFVAAAFAAAGLGLGKAAAHELESNNGISAVLHIAPDDNPTTGAQTVMYFDFTSQNPGFDLRYCNCRISYQSSDNRLNTSTILSQDGSATSGYTTTTFDKPGVYDVDVLGFTNANLNQRFKLDYRLRVTAGDNDPQNKTAVSLQIILLGATAVVLIGITASEMIRRGSRYAPKPRK